MAKLATSVALHCLSLTVPGEVVRAAALVAGCMARATGKTASSITTKTATTDRGTTAHADTSRSGARPGEMTRLSAVVAAAVAATSTTQTESRAVSLDMAQALAMIALLSLRRSGKGALVGFVALLPKGDPLVTRKLRSIK